MLVSQDETFRCQNFAGQGLRERTASSGDPLVGLPLWGLRRPVYLQWSLVERVFRVARWQPKQQQWQLQQ